jgi:hypothetical protein
MMTVEVVGAAAFQGSGGALVVIRGSGEVLQHRRRKATVRVDSIWGELRLCSPWKGDGDGASVKFQ